MKKMCMFAAVLGMALVAVAQEAEIKPGVIGLNAEGNLVRETVWRKYGDGAAPVFKDGVATITADDVKKMQGLSAMLTLNQTEAKPIVFHAESKAEDVSAPRNANYAFYLDIAYADGTSKYGVVALFNTGTHDWEKAESRFTPEKPIKAVRAYLLFRHKTGTVSFRNAFLGEEK